MLALGDVEVYSPRTVREALEILRRRAGSLRVIAGGTDLVVQLRTGAVRWRELLNIYGLDELRYIKYVDGEVKIGALTDFTTIHESPIVRSTAPVLAQAAFEIGSYMIMNKASIGGNIVNASPAADSLPALYVLEAVLKLENLDGYRMVPVREFYKGYKKLDMGPDELLTEVSYRALGDGWVGEFFKHGLRRGDAIAVVNGAVLLKWNGVERVVEDARVALGAVAPTVVRAVECEKMLRGSSLDERTIRECSEAVLTSISPIDDVRGSAAYRREMCVNYVYMTLWSLARRLGI
jgi:xanthine dehydrogenase FAD-binding subunit